MMARRHMMQRWTSSLWLAKRAFRRVFLPWANEVILVWKGTEWSLSVVYIMVYVQSRKRCTMIFHSVLRTHRTVSARAALVIPCVGEWLTFLARSSTDLSDSLLPSDTELPFSTESTSNLKTPASTVSFRCKGEENDLHRQWLTVWIISVNNHRINVRCIALSIGQVVHQHIQTLVFFIKKLLSPTRKD